MPCIGKPASVLVETCLHLIYLFLNATSVGRCHQAGLPAFVDSGLWAV
jgi:hypothetical protein